MTDDPRFAEPIPNVTVALGRDASLPCVVENLGKYKVQYFCLFCNRILRRVVVLVNLCSRNRITVIIYESGCCNSLKRHQYFFIIGENWDVELK